MKTNILGSAIVITSAVKLDDIKTIKKYKPEALTVWEKDEDGIKTPVYTCEVKPGYEGNLGENGAVFGKASPEGYAQITMIAKIPEDKEPEDFVADTCGKALLKLAKWEEAIPAVIEQLNADRDAVLASIEVIA